MEIDFLKMNETMIRSSEQKQKLVPKSNTEAMTGSFAEVLRRNINEVNDLQYQTKNLTQQFATGQLENVHDLMVASEKSGLALKTMNTMRRKFLEIYREVSQTRL